MRKRGLSDVIKTVLIIFSLLIAIMIVIIILYNVVKTDLDYVLEEPDVNLAIIEESVVINDNTISFTVFRGTGEGDLEKIKFILYDGDKTEEIILDASELKELKEKTFTITAGTLTDIDKILIAPIVKIKRKERTLAVSDTIEISYAGGETSFESVSAVCGNGIRETGEQCDDGNAIDEDGCSSNCELEISTIAIECSDCGSGLLVRCTRTECHSIINRCYYEGGVSRKCTDCSLITCRKYLDEEDCSTDRCELNCSWYEGECISKIVCGDGDCGAWENCSNCPQDCGVCIFCGDGNCNGGETYLTCPEDCPASCGDGNCSVDEDCSSCEVDCPCTYPTCCLNGGCIAEGICSYTHICSTGILIAHCGDGNCNCNETYLTCLLDCGSPLKELGETCSSASECESGYCVDDVCCNALCPKTQVCRTCGAYSYGGIGHCSYVGSSSQDPNNDCTQGSTISDGCSSNYCSGIGYSCGIIGHTPGLSGDGGCPVCGTCSDSETDCEYHPSGTHDIGCAQCKVCSGSEIGTCSNNAQNTDYGDNLYECIGSSAKCNNGVCEELYPCLPGQHVGDINGDGYVTTTDADLATYIDLNPPTPSNTCCGDVNEDGKIDVTDALMIASYLDNNPWGFC